MKSLRMLAIVGCWASLSGFSETYVPLSKEVEERTPPSHEWVYVGNTKSKVYYFMNPRTLKISGNIRKMWELTNDAGDSPGKSHQSTMALHEFDCASETYRILHLSGYSERHGHGELVFSESKPTRWDPVYPGSIGETKLQFVCQDSR